MTNVNPNRKYMQKEQAIPKQSVKILFLNWLFVF